MNGSTVSINSVSKHFGSFHALDDISITIKQGEFFSLLGPSGCGKTTLLRIIAGFEFPDEGAVLFDDFRLTNARAIQFSRATRFFRTVQFMRMSHFRFA